METFLQKMRETYKEVKQQQPSSKPTLQDITVNTRTNEYTFIWKDEEK
ncbi:MAG: hypothetical protein NUK65_09115 [Firmicutes bacterium]|nr:hypothetical protein [Bacillota bacterium]